MFLILFGIVQDTQKIRLEHHASSSTLKTERRPEIWAHAAIGATTSYFGNVAHKFFSRVESPKSVLLLVLLKLEK
jgi:hypothetical protein